MDYITRAIHVLRREGPLRLFKKSIYFTYNHHIAHLLPKTDAQYNGVNVHTYRYLDSIIPWESKDEPHYESGIISGLKGYVEEGDSIVIVGGGWGVTAVKAAKSTGDTGKVTVYEGAVKKVGHIKKTAEKNNVLDTVEIIHGYVGSPISLRGKSAGAVHVSPKKLPDCDVLELDCEGSEIEILKNLAITPRVILVETHGLNDAPSSKVKELLEQKSYSVVSKKVADKRAIKYCLENDIYCLIGIKS